MDALNHDLAIARLRNEWKRADTDERTLIEQDAAAVQVLVAAGLTRGGAR